MMIPVALSSALAAAAWAYWTNDTSLIKRLTAVVAAEVLVVLAVGIWALTALLG